MTLQHILIAACYILMSILVMSGIFMIFYVGIVFIFRLHDSCKNYKYYGKNSGNHERR